MTKPRQGATTGKPVHDDPNAETGGENASPPVADEAMDETCAVDFDAAHDRAS